MIENLLTYVLPYSMALLPGVMNTSQARAELLAIGLQESEFKARRQHGNGPARSFWQYEKLGIKDVLERSSSRVHALQVCAELLIMPTVEACYAALEYHDVLAACFARLTLWNVVGLPPDRGMPERGWRMYIDGWKPGKPRRDDWDANFAKAWTLVQP